MNVKKAALILTTLVILSISSWSKSDSVGAAGPLTSPATTPPEVTSALSTSPVENSKSLDQDVTVCTPDGGNYKNILSVTVTPNTGQTIFLEAKTTVKRVPCPTPRPSEGGCEHPTDTDTNLLVGMRIVCGGVTVQTTRNHRGVDQVTDNNGMVQFASLLYHPKPSALGRPVTCSLQALGGFDGKGCFKFLGNTSEATYLRASVRTGGVAWGTNLDTHNASDNDGQTVTFIGHGLARSTNSYPSGESLPELGNREFVLKGRRFNANARANSLNVFSDLQLTCESVVSACNVTADLLVQQMKSPTDKRVCSTTRVSHTATIDENSHHQKFHLKLLNVPFNLACSGRSFIIKTLVTLNTEQTSCRRILGIQFPPGDACDYVVVENGKDNNPVLSYRTGRSIAIVVQNFPVLNP